MESSTKNADKTNSGFSISSIMGFEDKCIKEDSTENVKQSKVPPSIVAVKAEKTKKLKRLSSNDAISADGKRYRATFDKAQIFHMERVFLINHYPDVASRSELSKATGLSESQVQIWFQNRRAKWRKQQRKRRQDIPAIFGLGYPTHLARMYPGFTDPYGMFPYEYYNTDFWSCAQQQIAAMHYSGLSPPSLGSCILTPPRSGDAHSPPVISPVSSPSSPASSSVSSGLETSPISKSEKEALEIRNDASLSTLRMKAKEHVAALEATASS